MTIRVLQLSDPHLLADSDGRLRGVPNNRSFRRVLHGEALNFDWTILTRDLAYDEKREIYQLLRGMLEKRNTPWRLIPGNHDSCVVMREVFPELSGRKGHFSSFSLELSGWKLSSSWIKYDRGSCISLRTLIVSRGKWACAQTNQTRETTNLGDRRL